MTAKRTPRSISYCIFPKCERPHFGKKYCQGHYWQLQQGKPLQPIQTRNQPRNKVQCERCDHIFFPRTENHQNRCSSCRGKFTSELSQTREKSRTAPPGKRWCRGCEKYRAEKFFPYTSARCKPCLKVYTTERRAQKVYSMDPGMYQKLWEYQGGRCAICQRATGATKALSVDHDHKCCPGKASCGKCIRGLLCGGCNYKVLGHLRDDVDALLRALSYLYDPPARHVRNT
jgi:hypothetical protein